MNLLLLGALTATLATSYAAQDYRKAKHPTLSDASVRTIKRMLTRVKTCQKRFLRYALLPSGQKGVPPFLVMFFGPVAPGMWPHALGMKNVYYDPVEGRAFPVSDAGWHYDYSIRNDVERLGCPRGDVIQDLAPPPARLGPGPQ